MSRRSGCISFRLRISILTPPCRYGYIIHCSTRPACGQPQSRTPPRARTGASRSAPSASHGAAWRDVLSAIGHNHAVEPPMEGSTFGQAPSMTEDVTESETRSSESHRLTAVISCRFWLLTFLRRRHGVLRLACSRSALPLRPCVPPVIRRPSSFRPHHSLIS